MDLKQQRIKIAEICGWTEIKHYPLSNYWWGRNPKTGELDFVPDYPGSLDAMHEAEKILLDCGDDWSVYFDLLMDIKVEAGGYQNAETLVHATAAQRAKAFLKTRKAWTT